MVASPSAGWGLVSFVGAKSYLGDVVRLRKPHPCGSTDWEIIRTGMDFRLRCTGCNRVVWISRSQFERSVKAIVRRQIAEQDE